MIRKAPEDRPPVIEVEGLTKKFGRFTAVDRIDFSVKKGEIFGFLGPNGAGKSTTIRMLCGVISSTSGRATVGGYDINRKPEEVRQHIGYMSQKFSLYRDLTVAENIAFFGGVYGLSGRELEKGAGEIVLMAGLSGLEDRVTGPLSGALQQRLALGCAILHNPPILFLDEPTSGVDPISRRAFWDLIQEMASRGVTVLITTHFMDEAEFCERIALISAGKLIAVGSPSALKREAAEGEDLFEVSLPLFRGAKEKVDGIDGVLASTYFGTRLHVFCRHGTYTAPELREALREKGLEARSVETVPVTLEDVFIRMVEKQSGGGQS